MSGKKKRKRNTDAVKKKKKKIHQEDEKEVGNEHFRDKNQTSSINLEKKKSTKNIPVNTDGFYMDDKMIQSSNLDFSDENYTDHSDTTLLLFYQYIEPPWDEKTYKYILHQMQELGENLGGRMRVAREGLNCTLTGTLRDICDFCKSLRNFHKGEFQETEFKLTRDLPINQRFPNLKIMTVNELVNYGLEKEKAPSIDYSGIHLNPKDYHQKLGEENTVVIDVRNHYEALIGHFDTPAAQVLDPKMRKSTEFPVWLDKKETKEALRGKQVLMYCTGGIRCERASALLRYKIDKDPEMKNLGIQGVYQLQGGVDKYFKEFPDGGYWSGKNYTFDKRFAHAPPKVDGALHSKNFNDDKSTNIAKGKCEACGKAWDKFRGKRRCPTCGVPSLICKDCMIKHKSGKNLLDHNVRCDLCVEQGIRSKKQLRDREQIEMNKYKDSLFRKGLLKLNDFETPSFQKCTKTEICSNPEGVTRLFLKNMCRKFMDEYTLTTALEGITHIVWRTDRKTRQFSGQAWVEMATSEDAAIAVGMSGKLVLGRPLYISYQPPDGKDLWPPPSSRLK